MSLHSIAPERVASLKYWTGGGGLLVWVSRVITNLKCPASHSWNEPTADEHHRCIRQLLGAERVVYCECTYTECIGYDTTHYFATQNYNSPYLCWACAINEHPSPFDAYQESYFGGPINV